MWQKKSVKKGYTHRSITSNSQLRKSIFGYPASIPVQRRNTKRIEGRKLHEIPIQHSKNHQNRQNCLLQGVVKQQPSWYWKDLTSNNNWRRYNRSSESINWKKIIIISKSRRLKLQGVAHLKSSWPNNTKNQIRRTRRVPHEKESKKGNWGMYSGS